MAGLPVAMMGASPGAAGAVKAQQHLKLVLLGMLSEVFPHRGVAVGRSGEKFDDDMRLTDDGAAPAGGFRRTPPDSARE